MTTKQEHEEFEHARVTEAFGMVSKAEAEKMARDAVLSLVKKIVEAGAKIGKGYTAYEFTRRTLDLCDEVIGRRGA